MPDVEPTSFQPPAFVRASAYTPSQVEQLGIPRGLVPYVPRAPAADAANDEPPNLPKPPDTKAGQAAPASATPRLGLGPRTRFRFQARDPESPVTPPSNLTSDPANSRRAGAVRKMPKMSRVARWLSFGSVAVAAGAAGYFLALPPSLDSDEGDGPESRVSTNRSWRPGDRRKLEAILVAESLRQPRKMKEILAGLRATQPRLAGLPILEARAAAASGSFADADASLVRTAQEPWADRVALSFARAANYGQQRRFDEMRACLSDAIALDPTRAEFHFQRAEVDRRKGRTQESLEGFDRALVLAKAGLVPSRETIEFRTPAALD